jgi:hypothetical protein
VKAAASFCGQCYADFRPPPPEVVVPEVMAPAQRTAEVDPLTAPLLDVVLRGPAAADVAAPSRKVGWPCARCQTVNDLDAQLCSLCGGGFLSAVSQDSKVTLVLPVVGDISSYSRGQRAGLALGALLIVLLPLALVTLLLTKGPSDSGTPAHGSGDSSSSTTGSATSP